MTGARGTSDKRILLWMFAVVFVLIVIVSILAPKGSDRDPRPTIDNSGTAGAKAAYLLLGQLGYKVQRWDAPEEDLDRLDAAHTTLIMADAVIPQKRLKDTKAAVQRFLERGGHVLDTGGETLLPNGETRPATALHTGLCYTTPEGQGPLAQAGQLAMGDNGTWDEKDSKLGAALHVEQRCGDDAVVVSYAVGKGEAIWWSSSMPLTNAGLHEDASLRLLLATAGAPGRTVLFDEYNHGVAPGFWDAAKGLPLRWLFAQLVLIAVLLVLSFSRRNGPVRMPVAIPRTSPVEFAESMGHLYQRAGATNAATGMARRRLLRFLQSECGVARITIDHGPAAVAEALHERFGGDWSALRRHLEDAAHAESTELAPNSALKLVQAMDDDVARLQSILAPKRLAAARETIATDLDEPVNDRSAELVSANKE
ncbi:MAG TPA: DUF4350 domain-containing protein [Acidobacteriaceae bacterium]|nr:DUF4350 domain-containing protein [Acidobacteriaceae bacterium]